MKRLSILIVLVGVLTVIVFNSIEGASVIVLERIKEASAAIMIPTPAQAVDNQRAAPSFNGQQSLNEGFLDGPTQMQKSLGAPCHQITANLTANARLDLPDLNEAFLDGPTQMQKLFGAPGLGHTKCPTSLKGFHLFEHSGL